jgi:spore germination protein YaaH
MDAYTMKKLLLICTLLAVACTMGGCTQRSEIRADIYSPFDDITNSYAKPYILDLHSRGIVHGEGNRTYGPHRPVTREAMAAMLGRTLDLEPVNAMIPAFKDVTPRSWSYGWVQAGVVRSLISGVTNDEFAPLRPVSRQEAAALFYRALPEKTNENTALPFRDAGAIAPWARSAASELYARGLMVGSQGKFRPHDQLTREEMAVLLFKFLRQPDFKEETSSLLQMGWHYMVTRDEFIARAKKASDMNVLSPRWYFLSSSGGADDNTDRTLLAWVQENRREVWPLVGNRFDRELTHQILASPVKRAELVTRLTEYTEQYKLNGLNIDFENIDPADRPHFTAFIAELASELHSRGKKVSVDVPPDLKDDWSDPYDFAALARHADYIVMMAYNETWEGKGQAGSNASLPWVQNHIQHMLTMVPRERLMVALPFYTMRWREVDGREKPESVTMSEMFQDIQASRVRPVWDERVGQYCVTYRKNKITYKAWLEESRSLALKYRAIKQLGAAGVAFWYIGSETDEVWAAIKNE